MLCIIFGKKKISLKANWCFFNLNIIFKLKPNKNLSYISSEKSTRRFLNYI